MPAALQFKPRTPVRIFVVDDSPMVRGVLRGLLERHDNWKVCGEASTGSEAVRNVDRVNPDVVILDFQMPEMNGLDAAETMTSQSPDLPILMVSTYMSPELARRHARQECAARVENKTSLVWSRPLTTYCTIRLTSELEPARRPQTVTCGRPSRSGSCNIRSFSQEV